MKKGMKCCVMIQIKEYFFKISIKDKTETFCTIFGIQLNHTINIDGVWSPIVCE